MTDDHLQRSESQHNGTGNMEEFYQLKSKVTQQSIVEEDNSQPANTSKNLKKKNQENYKFRSFFYAVKFTWITAKPLLMFSVPTYLSTNRL